MQIFERLWRWYQRWRGPRLLARRAVAEDGSVHVARGDVVLVRCAAPVEEAERQHLVSAFERAMPRRVRVIVIGPGVDFDVFTATAVAPLPAAGEA